MARRPASDSRRTSVIRRARARAAAPRRASAARAGPCGPRTASCRSASMPDTRANGERRHPDQERRPSADAARVGRVDRVDPADGPQPPADRDRDAERRTAARTSSRAASDRRGRRLGRAPGRGRATPRRGQRASDRRRARGRRADATDRARRSRLIARHASHERPTAVVALRRRTAPATRETRALRVEWPRFGPARSTAPAVSPVAAPRPRRAPSSRTLMSSSRRSRPSQTAIFALAVGAAAHRRDPHRCWIGVNVLPAAGVLDGLYPPIAVTTQGAEIRQPVRHRLPDRGRDLPRGRGADHLDGHPLPAQARRRRRCRRRPTATTSPSSSGRSSRRSSCIFMFVVSWQTLNAVDANVADAARPRSGRSPASSSGSSTTSPRTATTVLAERPIPLVAATAAGWRVPAGRTVQLSPASATDVIHAFYVPQFLFKRDVVPGRTNHVRLHGRRRGRRPDVPRPVRRAVRRRPPASCCSRSTP